MLRLFSQRIATVVAPTARANLAPASCQLFHSTALLNLTEGKVQGNCKWFDAMKGYGFIIPDDGSDDIFCHHTAIHADGFRSLEEGEVVEFNVSTDERTGKPRAENVTGMDGAFVAGSSKFDAYGNRV
jgi:cold shock CspA family protein